MYLSQLYECKVHVVRVIITCSQFWFLQQWWKAAAPALDAKAMFNFNFRDSSVTPGGGNVASAGDFEKFTMHMKSNKEGALLEGRVSQDGSHSEREMHEESPDCMQVDDSSGHSTSDSSRGMYTSLQEFVPKSG